MGTLTWNQTREYETGLDRGVFYPPSGLGEAWDGLISVTEKTAGSDEKTRYIDGIKTNVRRTKAFFGGTIQAFSYPNSFFTDILVDKRQKRFGMTYRVESAVGYKIHLVYNVLLSPSAYSRQQQNATMLSWDFTTLPLVVPNAAHSAHLVIDTAEAYPWTVEALEDVLYGSEEGPARLPSPEEVLSIFEENSILQIIDNGDGSWTAIGPDSIIEMLDSTTFQITWPSAVYIDSVSYTIHSL